MGQAGYRGIFGRFTELLNVEQQMRTPRPVRRKYTYRASLLSIVLLPVSVSVTRAEPLRIYLLLELQQQRRYLSSGQDDTQLVIWKSCILQLTGQLSGETGDGRGA